MKIFLIILPFIIVPQILALPAQQFEIEREEVTIQDIDNRVVSLEETSESVLGMAERLIPIVNRVVTEQCTINARIGEQLARVESENKLLKKELQGTRDLAESNKRYINGLHDRLDRTDKLVKEHTWSIEELEWCFDALTLSAGLLIAIMLGYMLKHEHKKKPETINQ